MKKREIIEIVNNANAWEKDSKLLDLLVQDGRLPTLHVSKCLTLNTYSVNIADGVRMIYYNRDAVVIVNHIEDTLEVLNFEIYCQDQNENDRANRRR